MSVWITSRIAEGLLEINGGMDISALDKQGVRWGASLSLLSFDCVCCVIEGREELER